MNAHDDYMSNYVGCALSKIEITVGDHETIFVNEDLDANFLIHSRFGWDANECMFCPVCDLKCKKEKRTTFRVRVSNPDSNVIRMVEVNVPDIIELPGKRFLRKS